jgi:hypothetical protein
MSAFVVPFLRRKVAANGWTQDELAEFYRVEAALIEAGMRVNTDRGMTDENDPWFVFFHADNDQEVIIHFARVGANYLVSAPTLGATEAGDDFRVLVRQLLSRYDDIAARRREGVAGKSNSGNGKIALHPAAMLWVLVALAFVKSAEARSTDGHHAGAGYDPALSPPRDSGNDPLAALISFALQSVVITWAVTTLTSDVHAGPDDKLLAWLAAEPAAVPETAATFHTTEYVTAGLSDDGHGTPETGWATHQGSGGTPMPGIVLAAASEHLVPEHANQFETVPVANAHAATEAGPFVMDHAPAVTPMAEAQAVFAAAEANTSAKTVESVNVPDALAGVLSHAIHASGEPQNLVNDVISHLSGQTVADQTGVGQTGVQTDAGQTGVGQTDAGHQTDAGQTDVGQTDGHTAGGQALVGQADNTQSDASHTSVGQTGVGGTTDVTPTDNSPVDAGHADAGHASTLQTGPAQMWTGAAAGAASGTPLPGVTANTDASLGHPVTGSTGSDASAIPAPVSATASLIPATVTLDQAEISVATAAVHEFLASVPQAVTIGSPNNLIVYDAMAVSIDLPQVQALTFDFSDGSHISLVGLPSELTHALTGHA